MTFRTLTPPKFAAALGDRQAIVLLEERLAQFILWLKEEKSLELYSTSATGCWPTPPKEVGALISEYVNS